MPPKVKNTYIANQLAPYYGGDNYLQQYNNASRGLQALEGINGITPQQKSDFGSQLKSIKGQAAIGGGLAALQGITGIASNAVSMGTINDTQSFENQIDNLGQIGSQNITSFEQLGDAYGRINQDLGIDYDSIRGGNTGERIGDTLSSALTGATTGLTVGGPWGALVGGVVGLGAGIGGWVAGDAAAKSKQEELEFKQRVAQNQAQQNLNAAGERLTESLFRDKVANVAKNGGQLKQQSLQEFANKVLKKKSVQRKQEPNHGVVRQHCNGGVMIRYKR